MAAVKYAIIIVASYLLGSLSLSIILSKALMGGDVRSKGSGNAGATNMARVYGLKAGALTLAADTLKAALSMLLGYLLMGEWGLSVAGIVCLIGHCFPAYYGFKGGKGVSVGAAIALAVDWRVFVIVVGSFIIAAFLSRKVSLGSVCASVAIGVSAILLGVSAPRALLALFGMALVIFQHRANIARLISGSEPDFHPAKKP